MKISVFVSFLKLSLSLKSPISNLKISKSQNLKIVLSPFHQDSGYGSMDRIDGVDETLRGQTPCMPAAALNCNLSLSQQKTFSF